MNSNQTQTNRGNILIVDDTPENLRVLSNTLSERGYRVRCVVTGPMAIRAARSALPPDLILLDIKMPDMNGYEVCDRLKSDPQTKEIPIIFISALDEVLDKVRAFSVGGADYITKPFQVDEVLARVDHQLTIRHLTEQLQAQNQQLQLEIEERRKAEAAAAAASKAKSEFITNLNHELRTPLNAILGFTQLMERDARLNNEHREYLSIINRSGENLLELINDVLELSKIEAGIISLNETCFDLYRLLDSIEDMFHIKAEQNNLRLIFIVPSDVPQYVRTDEKKLRSCLLNLVGNGIKFTESGSVTVRVRRGLGTGERVLGTGDWGLGTGDWGLGTGNESSQSPIPNHQSPITNPQSLVFEVEDTGLGIAPEEMESLFEAFMQTQTGRNYQEGTGLGLTIVRRFVQLMGGDITVESVLGEGTTFKFDIRIADADSSEIIAQPLRRVIGLEPDQGEYRILVVDDTPENCLLLVKLLEPIGFRVREAEHGKEGVAVWESWQPQLIWMDTRMPVMDGLEAARQIRSRESSTGVPPVGAQEQRSPDVGAGFTKNSSISQITSINPPSLEDRGEEESRGSTAAQGEPRVNFANNSSPASPAPNSSVPSPQSRTILIAFTASTFEENRAEILAAGFDDVVRKPTQEAVIFEKMAEFLGVRYIYEDLPRLTRSTARRSYLTAEKQDSFFFEEFAAMPLSWVKELYQASNEVNEELVQSLIEQIPENQASVASALTDLINDFRLDVIVRLTLSFLTNNDVD